MSQAVYWAVALAEIALAAFRMTDPNTLPSVIQHAVCTLLANVQDAPITFHFLLGTALVVIGGFFRRLCFDTLGRFFTFELAARKGHQLVKTGPYAIVRHPSYTAAVVQFSGVLILHGSRSSWLRHSGVLNIPGVETVIVAWLLWRAIIVTSLVCRIDSEEKVLKSMFGDEWQNWAKVVRYRLIPGIY